MKLSRHTLYRPHLWRRIKGVIFRRRYKLLAAIALLCEVHTDDGYADYDWRIKAGATPDPWIPSKSYVDAWRTLRRAVKKPTE